MTTTYSPARAFLTEEARDSAITQLADALDTLRIAREKRDAADFMSDNLDLIAGVHEATQRALAVAQIVVRRHALVQSV